MDQLGGTGRIRIHVAGNVHPLCPGLAKQFDHPGHTAVPVPGADGLEVGDLHGGIQGLGHGDHLFQGFHNLVAFLAHMDSDDGAGIFQRLQGFDHAFRIIKTFRCIAQAQADTQGTFPKALFQQFINEGILLIVQLAVIKTGGTATEGAHTHQHTIMDSLRNFRQLLLILSNGGKITTSRHIAHNRCQVIQNFLTVGSLDRSHGQAAVSVNYQGQALGQFRFAIARTEGCRFTMTVHIDEAGSQITAHRIQDLHCIFFLQIAHCGNFSVHYSHIGSKRCLTGTVHNHGVFNQIIIHKSAPLPKGFLVTIVTLCNLFCNGNP